MIHQQQDVQELLQALLEALDLTMAPTPEPPVLEEEFKQALSLKPEMDASSCPSSSSHASGVMHPDSDHRLPISRMFEGEMMDWTECHGCRTRTERANIFRDLPVRPSFLFFFSFISGIS